MLTTHYAHPGELSAPKVPPFTASPGLRYQLKDAKPLRTQLITYIIECRNAYAMTRLGLMPPSRWSLFRSWKPATFVEMKAFIGVILNMGLIQLSQLKDYWMTHEPINLQFFRRVFSRDRFLQLFWMLHVTDVGEVNGLTRRSKIQPFLDMIIPGFQRLFVPGKALAVDEAMIAYRGRVSFRQYVRGKPHPWGIKAYILADSDTGYLYSVAIYYGKETMLVSCPGLNHTTRVVLTLIQPVCNMGYDVYTDRFYSPLLARELCKLGITMTGTGQSWPIEETCHWLYGQRER